MEAHGEELNRDRLLAEAANYGARYEAEAIAAGAAARHQGHYGIEELVEVERWKKQGPYSRNIAENDPDWVQFVTARALAPVTGEESLEVERLRIESLTLMRGVQYRTASALLHLAHHPFGQPSSGFPLLDVRALRALGWTVAEKPAGFEEFGLWWDYVRRCRELADATELDLRMVDRALWVIGGGSP